MSKREKAMITLGCLVAVFGLACGVCADLGLDGTAFATGMLAAISLVALGPVSEMSG